MKTPTLLRATLAAAVLALSAAASPAHADLPPATHVVRMVMEGDKAAFEPAIVTIRPGDRVRFVVASGAPHNVAFDPARTPADMQRLLRAAMPDPMQPLSGKLLLADGESYTISFAGARPGRYEFYCLPHVGMQMKGTLVVR